MYFRERELNTSGFMIQASKNNKEWQDYCIKDINCNESDYKFCLCECELEDCHGQYHKYTTNQTQVEQEIIVGYYENGDAIYETVMVNVDEYTYLIGECDYISVEDYKVSIVMPKQSLSNDEIMVSTLAESLVNTLSKLNDVESRLTTLEGGGS